ncbi:diguanylate cyclase domain-containing protein [Pseudomonas citronellolis]|uniref:diguanylate cyclase domain-containing protein n=1 Tax=Pseudomonas citronellolis TaxID=53408 RepID=UPI0023E35772|nr:diguanylate cyclase [Pseudomonas citronellolis]MDF3933746.1 diguanylate cyclase [Pseudomonas citronellolis]
MSLPHLSERRASRRKSLGRLLYRAHLGVAMVSVCLVGLAVSVLGLLTLRAYAEHNLQLIARSMAYTAEAAVVFNDKAAAEEALHLIAASEEVSSCAVHDNDGHLLASWQRTHGKSLLRHFIGTLWLNHEAVQPIVHDGQVIGEVRLKGTGGRLLTFLLAGLGGMLVCLLLIALGVFYLSRRVVSRIVTPLDRLARVAHAVRRDRQFAQRVPPARIAELDELGGDFNALLDELENWQRHLERENASLAHQASHDSLTRLPNRAFFEGRLSRTLRELASRGERAAVLFIDSDRFKQINDRLGHAAGDAVLVAIAERLRGLLRDSDLVARLGGDEFAVLLAPLPDANTALRIADEILASMLVPIGLPDGGEVHTSLSVGVALYPQHGRLPTELLHSADAAMYAAKRSGPGHRSLARPTPSTPVSTPQEKARESLVPAPEPSARRPDPDRPAGRLPDAAAQGPDA